jgi:hypothetical protein
VEIMAMKKKQYIAVLAALSYQSSFVFELEPNPNDSKTAFMVSAVDVDLDMVNESSPDMLNHDECSSFSIRLSNKNPKQTNGTMPYANLGADTQELFRAGYVVRAYDQSLLEDDSTTSTKVSAPVLIPTHFEQDGIDSLSASNLVYGQILSTSNKGEVRCLITVWYDTKKLSELEWMKLQSACQCAIGSAGEGVPEVTYIQALTSY